LGKYPRGAGLFTDEILQAVHNHTSLTTYFKSIALFYKYPRFFTCPMLKILARGKRIAAIDVDEMTTVIVTTVGARTRCPRMQEHRRYGASLGGTKTRKRDILRVFFDVRFINIKVIIG
jgi:hypothetical protein